MKKVILLVIVGFCATALAQRFVRTANTIAELVASNPNNVHTNVLVLGLTNVNDSQGGAFSWVVGATNTTNGFAVFASSTATNGLWIRRSYSSDTNYGGNSYITNLYVTNITANTIYATNLYVTNIYTAGGFSGTFYKTNGAGADFQHSIGTDTYEEVIFGTSGPAFVITNAGTFQITLSVACYDAATFPQTFYITNVTDNLHVAGPYSTFVTSASYYPLTFNVQMTTTNLLTTNQLVGKTANTTYTQAGVGATNTVITVIRLQ